MEKKSLILKCYTLSFNYGIVRLHIHLVLRCFLPRVRLPAFIERVEWVIFTGFTRLEVVSFLFFFVRVKEKKPSFTVASQATLAAFQRRRTEFFFIFWLPSSSRGCPGVSGR